MANEINLKLITSEFSGDEAKKVEYASLVGFALDSIKRKEKLEGIYTCYVPFYAQRVSEGNFIIINTLDTNKNKFTISKIPTLSDIKPVLNETYSSLEEHYKAIENTVLVKKALDGIAKLITQHSGTRSSSFKRISPIVSREDIKRDIASVGKYAITEAEIESNLNHILDEVESFLEKQVGEQKRELEKIASKYDQLIEEQKRENERRIQEINQEEKEAKRKIDEEAERERREQVRSVKDSKRWNQLKKDIASMQEAYSDLLASLDRLQTGEDFETLSSKIRAVQDETQSFGVGLNTAISEIEYRKTEYDDIKQQAEVDKRNVSDRMRTAKENLKQNLLDLKDEKEIQLEEQRDIIAQSQQVLEKFQNNKANLKKKILSNYVTFSDYAISADLLGVDESVQYVVINIPVAICKYKESTKLSYLVIPPFEISERMKKPKSLPLHSTNGGIGFDCIAVESINFLKKPLENLLATNQNIQAEVQGDNNEILRLGDLSTLNAGLVLLEQRKKFNKKNADSILAKSRSILS
ncbi:MAG: coiled-coil domain-containing protein [Candidatus Heimdallarchaeaceae archaeon]